LVSKRELEAATAKLEAAKVASPRADAELLLSFVTGVPRGLLTMMARVDDVQRLKFMSLVDARAQRVPLQHLTGRAPFRHLDLEVGPGVFVPRPETESLAGWAIEQLAAHSEPIVVDLCTGSGAIALSIVDEVPRAHVHAVELDEKAYGWAHRNLEGTGVDLRLGDMADAFEELNGTVDVVVCNPPYIPLTAWESVEPEARDYDPELSLWSGDDGLDAMRTLERVAWRLLRPGGVVAAEHAEVQHDDVQRVFSSRWSDVRDREDLAGRPRFVTAVKP
jgi:release factor glutamine methyltransferase